MYVIGQWSLRLPVLYTYVIVCCGAHATKDLQLMFPRFLRSCLMKQLLIISKLQC